MKEALEKWMAYLPGRATPEGQDAWRQGWHARASWSTCAPDVGLQPPGERFAGWETGWKRSGRAVAARSPQDAFVHGAVR